MSLWLAIAGGIVGAAAFVALPIARTRERVRVAERVNALARNASGVSCAHVDFGALADLPPPVARYLRFALTDGQRPVRAVRMRQSGILRTGLGKARWLAFSAHQSTFPATRGFVWDARIGLPLGLHVRVLDGYGAGTGTGRVTLLSAIPLASQAGGPELNSGALQRYLAEAVWYPSALLPAAGVVWTPIDEHAALATLTDSGVTVSLEFRFGESGEVTGIFTSGRFCRFRGGYRKLPWEGHFRDYRAHRGMRVPMYGEVGWHNDDGLELVWKGNVEDVCYGFDS